MELKSIHPDVTRRPTAVRTNQTLMVLRSDFVMGRTAGCTWASTATIAAATPPSARLRTTAGASKP